MKTLHSLDDGRRLPAGRLLQIICAGAVSLLACWTLFTPAAHGQTTANTDPLGCVGYSFPGNAPSFVGAALTRPVEYQGVVDSVSGSTIVQNSATWADNAYNGTNNAYYVEFTSGAQTGLRLDVTATTAADHSVTLSNAPTGVAAGDTFKLRKHWTLGGLFGATTLGGGTSTTADQVQVLSTTTQALQNYFYKTSGAGGTGWRLSGGSTSADTSGVVIYPDEGFLINRKVADAADFLLLGAVKIGSTQIPIVIGITFVVNPYPVPLPISVFFLPQQGPPYHVLTGGTSTTADTVSIWDPTAQVLRTYFYKTSGAGGTGVRLSGGSTSQDQSNVTVPVGGMALVNHKATGATAFMLTLSQPF